MRNQEAAYSQRMMDPTLAATPAKVAVPRRKQQGVAVAFGPEGGTSGENLSVVIGAIEPGFTLRGALGPPMEAAERVRSARPPAALARPHRSPARTARFVCRRLPPTPSIVSAVALTRPNDPQDQRGQRLTWGHHCRSPHLLAPVYACVLQLLAATIAKQSVVDSTTLLDAFERPSARSGLPLYQFAYRVQYVGGVQKPSYTGSHSLHPPAPGPMAHRVRCDPLCSLRAPTPAHGGRFLLPSPKPPTSSCHVPCLCAPLAVCVVGTRDGQLYTFASRVPATVWEEKEAALREVASSFVLS